MKAHWRLLIVATLGTIVFGVWGYMVTTRVNAYLKKMNDKAAADDARYRKQQATRVR